MTEGIGVELRSAREALGLSVSEVAQQLKFAPRQLEALEQERFDLLPGGTFVRGMLRNYARMLKLAPEPLMERIAGRFEAPDANNLAARYSQPVPFSDSARRSTFVYLGLSLGVLALGAGVAYQWYREHKAAGAQLAAGKRAATRPLAAAAPKPQPRVLEPVAQAELSPKVTAAREAPPPAADRAPVAKVAAQSAPKPAALEEPKLAAVTPAAKVTAPDPPKGAAPTPAKTYAGVNRLIIRCEEEAWIEVKDANDRMLISSLNPAGAERVVKARGPLTLVIGNAQHVRVIHNDRPVDLTPHTKLAIARFTLP
jgi:cytoskeleton protein RodZ